MHYSTTEHNHQEQATCCECCCRGPATVAAAADDELPVSRRLSKPTREPPITSSRKRNRRRHRPLPKIWTALALGALLPTVITTMWRVHAFSGRLPHHRTAAARMGSHGRLAAINSRELRFFHGSADPRDKVPQQRSASSLPEVLAASMANYFFANGGNNIKLGSLLAGDNEHREDALRQEQQRSFATTTTTRSSSSPLISSSSTTTSSRTVVQTTTSTTVLSPAPQSLLLSQHTFRALGTVARGAGRGDPTNTHDSEEEEEDAQIRLNGQTFNGQSHESVPRSRSGGESISSSSGKVNGGSAS